MNDKQIQTFLMVYKKGSMNRAAEELYISQPALKKRMDTLEMEVGVPLFERGASGCVLTEAGKYFADEIEMVYKKVDEIILKTRSKKKHQVMRVCTMEDISVRMQDEQLIYFVRENPDIDVQRVILPTNQWIEAVIDSRADLCRSFYTKDGTELLHEKKLRCFQDKRKAKTVCIVSPGHPLSEKKKIRIEDLKGQRICAGPLLYYYSGLKEYAETEGLDIVCDESAGRRYEMIQCCEKGMVYIHPLAYAEDLKPLRMVAFSGFSCWGCWICREESSQAIDRFLRFFESRC